MTVDAIGDDHPPCGFYCHADEHCDLAHWHSSSWTEAEVRRVWARHGVTVTRIVPAPEAPRRHDGADPHLVYWRRGPAV